MQVTDEGAIAIAEMLKVNRSLRYINLGSNKITDAGARKFLEVLDKNKSLVELELKENYISDTYMSAIRALLDRNKRMVKEEHRKFKEVTKKLEKAAWNRSKLMIIGQGRAGKTVCAEEYIFLRFDVNE